MKVLILGSSGLIGNHLKWHLGKTHNIVSYDIKQCEIEDLSNNENNFFLLESIDRADFVFFLAYDVGGSKYLGQNNTLQILNNNIRIMDNVFNALEQCKKPFIFTSSQMSNMLHSPYGCLKRIGEHYTNILGGVNVRFWNVYGKEEYGPKSHVINDFIWQAKNNGKIQMMTDGKEQRQFLHVNDCCVALMNLTIEYNKLDKSKYYDITSFKWTSILDIAKIVGNHYKAKVLSGDRKDTTQLNMKNEPTDHILQYWAGPKISLEDGIHNLIYNFVYRRIND